MRKWLSVLILALVALPAFSQGNRTVQITGTIIDDSDGTPLPGVNVVVVATADSTQRQGTITDSDGKFTLNGRRQGAMTLRFSYIGFQTIEQPLPRGQNIDLGTIGLKHDVISLDQVQITGTQERVQLKGDTTVYNARAFKTNPDATVEDLVAKMPGVTVENGTVQAQGEAVQKVTIDGREFFGDDPSATLKNLPADMVEKVEVYDRASEQAQFTGFNDGNTEKTINIVTRSGRSNGQFGKFYGGAGQDQDSEGRYIAGGNLNLFDRDRRISIIGLSNNVNQQNFSFEDILGVTGNTGGGARGGGMRGGGRPGGGGGFRGGRGDVGNFMTGSQGGINNTNSIGLNYNDLIGKKLRLSGSYFFNNSGNNSNTLLDRVYTGQNPQNYAELNRSESDNFNHRLNMRVELEIDSNNSVQIRPRVSAQQNSSVSFLNGSTNTIQGAPILSTENNYDRGSRGYNASTSILWRHRFAKRGRTISSELNLSMNDRWGDDTQATDYRYFGEQPDSSFNQLTDSDTYGDSYSMNLAYTEPLGKNGQIQLSYRPSIGNNQADRQALLMDYDTGEYVLLQPALSNTYENTVTAHRGGASYRFNSEKFEFSLGMNVQDQTLSGKQTYPMAYSVDRSFFSLLPSASVELNFDRTKNLRLHYNTSADVPSIGQLQSAINNTNPQFLSTGNPDLVQSYQHSLFGRIHWMNPQGGRSFFGFLGLNQTENYIGNETFIASRDTLMGEGVLLARGGQFSKPVNLDGYWNARSFMSFGFPVSFLKSNLNLNVGASYGRTPSLLDGRSNISDVVNLNGGLMLGSNISERLDFSIGYTGNYNNAVYSQRPENDTFYWLHSGWGRLNWLPWKQVIVETTANVSRYTGRDTPPENVMVWNAGLGYKFLRGDAAEVKLVVADILNRNKSVNRFAGETYIENNRTDVLGRYLVLNFTYRIKNFSL